MAQGGDAEVKAAWVRRVLGIDVAGAPTAARADPSRGLAAAVTQWRDAIAVVDGQIEALQAKLRGYKHPDLDDIAEFGLNALTAGHKVKVLAGLAGARSGAEPDRKKLGATLDSFIDHLQSDPRVSAADANPFKVPMSIRATLVPALRDMKQSLAL